MGFFFIHWLEWLLTNEPPTTSVLRISLQLFRTVRKRLNSTCFYLINQSSSEIKNVSPPHLQNLCNVSSVAKLFSSKTSTKQNKTNHLNSCYIAFPGRNTITVWMSKLDTIPYKNTIYIYIYIYIYIIWYVPLSWQQSSGLFRLLLYWPQFRLTTLAGPTLVKCRQIRNQTLFLSQSYHLFPMFHRGWISHILIEILLNLLYTIHQTAIFSIPTGEMMVSSLTNIAENLPSWAVSRTNVRVDYLQENVHNTTKHNLYK